MKLVHFLLGKGLDLEFVHWGADESRAAEMAARDFAPRPRPFSVRKGATEPESRVLD